MTKTRSMAARTDYASMKPFDIRCTWWRPEMASREVTGSVGFDGSDIVAQMDEWVGPEHPSSLPTAEILHAKTNDGIAVTLYDAFISTFGWDGRNVHLIANSMAVGSHLRPQSQQEFTNATALINGLDAWWRTQPIRCDHERDGSVILHGEPPSSIDFSIPEKSVTLSLSETQSQLGEGRCVNIAYEPVLRVMPDRPQTFEWVHQIVEETRQLVSLFCDQDTALVGLRMTLKDSGHSHDELEWYWNRRDAEIHDLRLSRILLTYDAVKDELRQAIGNWLSRAEDRRQASALLFATQASPAPFLETRFLPIVQALEVYCRALGNEKYIEESEFDALKQKLFKIVPADLSRGLKQKLCTSIGFANELGLSDRIRQLLESLEQDTRHFVCQDAKKFASRLTYSRNYYTHYGPSKRKELRGKALHWATQQASLLLKILLLKDCGISEALIQDRLRHSGYHSQGSQIWATIEKDL